MISFPNAKINLGLQIVERRPDGYHNLETVFYPIPVEDASLFGLFAPDSPLPDEDFGPGAFVWKGIL